jgi:hypothetical protein
LRNIHKIDSKNLNVIVKPCCKPLLGRFYFPN